MQPEKWTFHCGMKGFVCLFQFFPFSLHWENGEKKKTISGHPYIFSQIFQFSLQTEKPGGHSLLASLLSLFLFESDLK